jgi:SAM-dependent methyltransferase
MQGGETELSPESKNIKEIYSGKVARKYDFSMPPFFKSWKKKAINESSLKSGDRVLVFCCGTGLDFPYILEKIGRDGKIIGVDFSGEMLDSARKKIRRNRWENIELVEADITEFGDELVPPADAGICTLGLSIIPDFKAGYYNLLSNVRDGGEIIIGDMQLASGWRARLNPVTVMMARKFGGSHDGHQNSLELYSMINEDLVEVRKREFFFRSYYYCIGRRRRNPDAVLVTGN